MRILILSNLYPPNVVGGYERLCFEVTAGLAKLGHEMIVLTSRYGGKTEDFAGQRIIRTLDLLTGPDIYMPFPGTQEDRAAINRSNLATLSSVLQEVRPDVVFAWNLFFLDASILTALEKSGIRTVVMLTDNWLLVMRNPVFVSDFFRDVVHGNEPFEALASSPAPLPSPVPLPAPAWTRVRQGLSRLFGVTRDRKALPLEAIFGARFMRDFYAAGGSTFERSKIVHNGVKQASHAVRQARDRSHFVDPDSLKLLFAGRLVDLKGAHTAVEALPFLKPEALGVQSVELTVLGDAQDAAYMQQLKETIDRSPCAHRILMRLPVAEHELFDLFDAYDIYLFPSLYEPFSLTLIHAMACGIPTIASTAGGNPEILRDGEGGLLFKKGDAKDLARAIVRLATDPALRRAVAQGGARAASHFTFERMIDEMASFLANPS